MPASLFANKVFIIKFTQLVHVALGFVFTFIVTDAETVIVPPEVRDVLFE